MLPLEMKQNVVNKELDEKKFNQVKATEGQGGRKTLIISVNISVGRLRPRLCTSSLYHNMIIYDDDITTIFRYKCISGGVP